MITVNGRILQKRDTTANWNYVNPVLPAKQIGWEVENDGITQLGAKMGDGTTAWVNLPYLFGYFKLTYASTTSLPITITATQLGQPIINFGRFPKIHVLLLAGLNNLNQDLPGFTVGTIETVSGTPNSIVVDDGSGALAYDIMIIISKQ